MNGPINKMFEVTCNKCGWVSFEVSREEAKTYGNPIEYYEKCNNVFCKNDYKDFRDSVEGDAPRGCTIGPIITRRD